MCVSISWPGATVTVHGMDAAFDFLEKKLCPAGKAAPSANSRSTLQPTQMAVRTAEASSEAKRGRKMTVQKTSTAGSRKSGLMFLVKIHMASTRVVR